MPVVAAFIDELRAAFGKAEIDQAIRDGLRNGTFHARENGHEVGTPQDDIDRGVTLDRMVRFTPAEETKRRK